MLSLVLGWTLATVPLAVPAPGPLLEQRLRHGRVSYSACFDEDREKPLLKALTSDEAVTALHQLGATREPAVALQHLLLGCLLWRAGSKDDSLRDQAALHFRAAATEAGESLLVTDTLGFVAVNLGKLPYPLRTAGLENARPKARADYWRGLAHLRGEPKDLLAARKELESSLAASKDGDAMRVLADVVHQLGDDTRALELLNSLPKPAHTPASRLLWGRLLTAGHAADAVAVLQPLHEEAVQQRKGRSRDRRPYHERVQASEVACALGSAWLAAGDEGHARAALEDGHCVEGLAQLHLAHGNAWEAFLLLQARGSSVEELRLLDDVQKQLGHPELRARTRERLQHSCAARPQPACARLPKDEDPPPSTVTGWEPAVLAELEKRLETLPTQPLTESPWDDDARFPELRKTTPPTPEAGHAFTVVHAAASDQGEAALVLSRDLHPMGEVGRGGWWLLLRPVGASRWSAPAWLGAAERFPYARSEEARIVAISSKVVTLRLLRAPVEMDSITYPPVALKTCEPPRRVRVDVDLTRLLADADGDGVTDLVEHKMLTRADAGDSDGDGIPDATDPLPLQPGQPGADAVTAAILEAALNHIRGVRVTAVVEKVPSVAPREVEKTSAPQVLFLTLESPLLLHAPVTGQRVVFPRAMLKKYRAMFGPTEPLSLGPVVLSPDGREAFVGYSGGYHWGSLRVTRQADGTWKATRLSYVIS